MIRAEASTVQVVARSARELRIWIDTDVGTPGGEDAVLVVAHHALWAVVHDPLGILGWIAVRLDRHQTEIPGTGGWLGTCDLEPEQILANLLEQDELPTDLFGRRPRVPTRHPSSIEPPTSTYLDCPACGHIAPVDTAVYHLIPDDQVDLEQAVVVRCAICGYTTDGRPYARTRTHEHGCPYCGTPTRAPWQPSRVACRGCGRRYIPAAIKDTDTELDLLLTEEASRHLEAVDRDPTVTRSGFPTDTGLAAAYGLRGPPTGQGRTAVPRKHRLPTPAGRAALAWPSR